RNRYLARSRPGIGRHTRSYARRAARTAASTSAGPASATSASTSSVAGLIVLNTPPSVGSTNSPLMNSPYDGFRSTMARDSGAGAYSNRGMRTSVQGHVVGAGIVAGGQSLPLHQQVVEQARGAEPEPVGGHPVLPGHLVDQHQVPDRVLGGPDAAGRLDPDLPPGGGAEVPDRLQHHQHHRQGGRRRHLAGRGLDH